MFAFQSLITNYLRNNINICKCTHFISKVNSGYSDLTEGQCCFRYYSGDTGMYFYMSTNDYSTKGEFATWLATQYANGTPVKVYYVLAAPVIEQITDVDTLAALNQLDTATLYAGYTEVNSASGDVGANINWQYNAIKESPAPNKPAKLITVGDNVNLFDKNNVNKLNAQSYQQKVTTDSNMRMLYIPCKPNTTYTVSKNSRGSDAIFQLGSTAVVPANGVDIIGVISHSNYSQITITTSAESQYLICTYYNTNDTLVTESEILNSIKIEEGDRATGYSKYNYGGISVQIKSRNLLGGFYYKTTNGGVTYETLEDGSVILNNTATANATYSISSVAAKDNYFAFTLKAGTYTLSGGDSKFEITLVDISTSTAEVLQTTGFSSTAITFTTTEDKYVFWRVHGKNGTTYSNDVCYPMLVESATEIPYEPCQIQTYNIPLASTRKLCKIGNYVDYIYKNKWDNKWYK